jgi:hypothetical protein
MLGFISGGAVNWDRGERVNAFPKKLQIFAHYRENLQASFSPGTG